MFVSLVLLLAAVSASRLSVHEVVIIDGVGVDQSLAKSHTKEMENKQQS